MPASVHPLGRKPASEEVSHEGPGRGGFIIAGPHLRVACSKSHANEMCSLSSSPKAKMRALHAYLLDVGIVQLRARGRAQGLREAAQCRKTVYATALMFHPVSSASMLAGQAAGPSCFSACTRWLPFYLSVPVADIDG